MIPHDDRHVLANRAGLYREAPPVAALRAHFSCVWTNTISGERPVTAAVVPDGCVDLMWRDDAFTVVGPDASAANRILSPGTVVGLRFRPGAAAAWLGLPLDEIVGRELPMAEFWKSKAEQVAESLIEAKTPTRQAVVLQERMVAIAADFAPPPLEASALFAALGAANQNRIAALPDQLNMSERTLRRWSHKHFGYGPKTLARILRMQRVQALASDTGQLVGLALEAGYADQAHLSREIQALCGMTAREFVRQSARVQPALLG